MVYYKLILVFSKGIGPAPITNENYPESLQGKTAKQGFEDYHMTYNMGERLLVGENETSITPHESSLYLCSTHQNEGNNTPDLTILG